MRQTTLSYEIYRFIANKDKKRSYPFKIAYCQLVRGQGNHCRYITSMLQDLRLPSAIFHACEDSILLF